MIANRLAYTIDLFRLQRGRPGGAPAELVLAGRFLGERRTIGMALALEGAAALVLPITAFDLPNNDIAAMLGPAGGDGRFMLNAAVEPDAVAFTRAVLRVEMQHGHRCDIDVTGLFQDCMAQGGVVAQAGDSGLADHFESLDRFESLGDNRELGLLQDALGSRRPGLFRHAACPSAKRLAEAIERRFAGFAAPGTLRCALHEGGWVVIEGPLGYVRHTGLAQAAMTGAQVCAHEAARLPALAAALVQAVELGETIFVRRVNEGEAEAGMAELFRAMRRIGPARLLWVTQADARTPAGTVRQVQDGLFRGGIARLAPYRNPAASSVPAWTALLARAAVVMGQAAAPPPAMPQPTAHGASTPAHGAPVSDALFKHGQWRRLFGELD